MLEVRRLSVAYGGIKAVKGIDFQVAPGEFVCLIGANGAGKTTTLRALCGLLPHTGAVIFDGLTVTPAHSTHVLARRGMALVPEGRGIFGRLSVEENLSMGAYSVSDKQQIKNDLQRMFELFPRLAERRRQQAGTLSGGEQQMLALGRALMSRPRLLLLDEPSMGLAPLMVQKIFTIIRTIAEQGVTLLLVEQNAKLALEISHRGYVMESGVITLADTASALANNPAVKRAYLAGD